MSVRVAQARTLLLLESLRLWPTTPAVLRDTTVTTEWANGTLPTGSAVLIFAPFFHRDSLRLPYADSFCPEIWLDGRAEGDPALIPFSDGPAVCPGRNLVLLLTSSVLAALIEHDGFRQSCPRALEGRSALPATLNPFGLRFAVRSPAGVSPLPAGAREGPWDRRRSVSRS